MLELNAARVGKRGIAYRVVDAFALEPTHDRDVVFFGFFLSHVPPGRVEAFWRLVDGLLAPGGRVLFVDETDHGLWEEEWVDREAGIIRRRLEDGTVHRAVKVLWRPAKLQRRLTELGWTAAIQRVGPFLWGIALLRAH